MNTRIKNLRTELGLSQEDFAKQLNISRNFIWMIEKGEREPSDRTVLDICRIFHVNEEWLRTGNGEMFQNKSRETEIAEMTAAMFKADDSDKRYQLMRLLNSISDDELETFFAAAKRWVDSVEIKEE